MRGSLCAIVLLLPGFVLGQEVVTLFDFEGAKLSNDWTGVGKIEAARVELAKDDLPKEGGPTGFGVSLKSAGGGGLFTKAPRLPAELLSAAEVELWIHRSTDEAKAHPASVIEVQFLEGGGPVRFFRKVELTHTGWKKIELPLKFFRWGTATIPRWNEVSRLGIWLRDAAEIQVDVVAVERAKGGDAALLQPDDLAAIAFPDADAKSVRRVATDQRLVLTNVPQFDLQAFSTHLDEVEAAVFKDLPFLGPPSNRATLVVFATEDEYRRFTPRLAERFVSEAREPRSGGFTLLGIATSSWMGERPRPVFTHEYVHSLLSMRADLDNRSEWFQEGLANYYQLRFYPQDLERIVAPAMSDASLRLPLKELADGRAIPTNRYWQAVTLVELLVEKDPYRGKLKDLFAAFAAAGSTDLGPQLAPIYDTDWTALEAAWRKHCEAKYVR
jgi:hypothetical protein